MDSSFNRQCAIDWESDPMLRNRGRELNHLTTWPSNEQTGIPSSRACAMNAKALEIIIKWWSELEPLLPKVIPVSEVRVQVWV